MTIDRLHFVVLEFAAGLAREFLSCRSVFLENFAVGGDVENGGPDQRGFGQQGDQDGENGIEMDVAKEGFAHTHQRIRRP